MNYYQARELLKDGKGTGLWHYTCMNDSAVWPVGNCANGCPGHATPEEACEHQRQYLMDKAVYRGPKQEPWPKHKCALETCNSEATHLIDIPGTMRHWDVCAEHANRDALASLMPSVGESISSY